MTDRQLMLKHLGAKVQALLTGSRDRHPEALEDKLSPEEVLELIGPDWSSMTTRQRLLYPSGLSEAEKDELWGERSGENRADAA